MFCWLIIECTWLTCLKIPSNAKQNQNSHSRTLIEMSSTCYFKCKGTKNYVRSAAIPACSFFWNSIVCECARQTCLLMREQNTVMNEEILIRYVQFIIFIKSSINSNYSLFCASMKLWVEQPINVLMSKLLS